MIELVQMSENSGFLTFAFEINHTKVDDATKENQNEDRIAKQFTLPVFEQEIRTLNTNKFEISMC